MISVSLLETIVRTPTLGIRCIDSANGAIVNRGLQVWATAMGPGGQYGSGRTIRAKMSRSGVFILQGVAELQAFETSSVPFSTSSISPSSPPPQYIIQVFDRLNRYLSWAMVISLPKADPIEAPLFALPSRPPIPGFAAVRGALADDLRDPVAGRPCPASYARIEAAYEQTPGILYTAISDRRGQFLLHLPLPNVLQPPSGVAVTSPNTSGRQALSELSWPLRLYFFYAPASRRFVCSAPGGQTRRIQGDAHLPRQQGWHCVPDIESLLTQSESPLPGSSPPSHSLTVAVSVGQETVARTSEDEPYIRLRPLLSSP